VPLPAVETNDGLALVDTGIGLEISPTRRGSDRNGCDRRRPVSTPAETPVQQVKALGYSPSDVRHLLLTISIAIMPADSGFP